MFLKRFSAPAQLLSLFVLMTPSAALAESESPWDLSAAASLSAADGNSESLAYSLQLLAEYDGELYDAQLGLDHFYAEKGSVESSNSIKFHEQLSRELTQYWYLSQYGSILNDAVADIDYRIDTSVLLGRHLLKSEKAKLSLELGPGYAWEQKGGESDHYMTARLGQRFEYRLSEDVRLWQSFGWTPRVEDLSDGIYELELGIENRLNGALSLRSFVRHRVDTAPAAGQDRSDTALMMGVNYEFGGGDDVAESTGPDVTQALLGSALSASDQPWETTAAFGFTLNRGNADKTGIKLDWSSDYITEQRELQWELGYHYADDAGLTSTDRLHSRLQGNRQIEGPYYIGTALGYLRDDLAAIDYRLTPSILLGRRLIFTDRTRLVLEAGPMMTFEQTDDGYDQYPSLMLAQRLKHEFNDRVSLKQSVVATSAFDDPERYILASKLALDTKLNSHLSWRCELESRYENLPVNGRDHHDLLLTSGVAWSF